MPAASGQAGDAALEEAVREMIAVETGQQALDAGQETVRRVRLPDIASLRHEMGLSQPAFAARLGIPVGTLRNWEQGRRRPPQAARILLRAIEARHREAASEAASAGAAAGASLTKTSLVETVASRAHLSARDAQAAVDAVLGAIATTLSHGGDVRLVGFGTFSVDREGAAEGEAGAGRKRRMPKFRPGKGLKDTVN